MKDDNDFVIQLFDGFRRLSCHYGLWFAETCRELGVERGTKAEAMAGDRACRILAAKFCRALSAGCSEGIPEVLASLERKQREALLDAVSTGWLAVDGVWFQAVESLESMEAAKRVNDTCWTRFSPLEASRIKTLLDLPERAGLDGLETALGHRLYSRINEQELVREGDSLVLYMKTCRVQDARKRKGLQDYPCKSGGIAEYTTFAWAVDRRLRTTCLACPPDDHPEGWWCAWRFEMEEGLPG